MESQKITGRMITRPMCNKECVMNNIKHTNNQSETRPTDRGRIRGWDTRDVMTRRRNILRPKRDLAMMDKRKTKSAETSNNSSPLPHIIMSVGANTIPITNNLPAVYHVPHCSDTITRPMEGLLNAADEEHTPVVPFFVAQRRALEHPNESMSDYDTRSMMWSHAVAASERLENSTLLGEFPALVSSLARGLYDPPREGGVSIVHGTSALERRCMMYSSANDSHLLAEIQETRFEVGGLLRRSMLIPLKPAFLDGGDASGDGAAAEGDQDHLGVDEGDPSISRRDHRDDGGGCPRPEEVQRRVRVDREEGRSPEEDDIPGNRFRSVAK